MSTQTAELGGARMPLLVLDGVQAWAVASGIRPMLPMHCQVPPHWAGRAVAIGAAQHGLRDGWAQFLSELDMARAVGLPAQVPLVSQLIEQAGRVVAVVHLDGPGRHWTELRGELVDVWAGAPWNWRMVCARPLAKPVLTARCAQSGLRYLDGTAVVAVSSQIGGV